ncbi:MAG: HAD family hydrolase [Chloroflexota bacterium]
MLKAILFDLDGTLLDCDTDLFLVHYTKLLAEAMAEHIPPQLLVKQLMASTEAMVRNLDSQTTNREAFNADFFPRVNRRRDDLEPLFEQFYRERFPSLRSRAKRKPAARRIVEAASRRGWDIVVATNPVFPLIAIEERMRWAGVDGLPWKLVTSYEMMHYCKPNPEYYQEVAALIGRRPEECLMVGNDTLEDLIARKLGMWTFLAEENMIDRGAKGLQPHLRGQLADLLPLIDSGDLPAALQRAGE